MENPDLIQPRLLALNGEAEQTAIPLELEVNASFTFGRSPACDLQIKDIAVSRQHCRIVISDENLRLEDLGSHNGTFVNDLPVNNHLLKHGDQIRIGNAYYLFLDSDISDTTFYNAEFDAGTVVTNSTIQLFPNRTAADFPTDLNVLVKFGKAINEIKNLETLQRVILETILEIVPARRGAIIKVAGKLEDSQPICVSVRDYHTTAPMKISRTVSEQVLREQVALMSNDLVDKNLDTAESLIASRVSSLLCIPLKIGDYKGLIYLDADEPKIRFTETHLEQMTAISFLVSAALTNLESMELLREENRILKDDLHIETNMIGESAEIKKVLDLVGKVAQSSSTVLITGESGTGKELVARTIHQNSARRKKPFVAINCANLNEGLLESELFGYERGAFTGAFKQKKGKIEIADGGTVFLDEIGDLSPSVQTKLLRFLQEREFQRVGGNQTIKVSVRVIAATNRNLVEAVNRGFFRQDLYYRLNVVPIEVPSLRERIADIPLLIRHFIRKYNELCHRKINGISAQAEKILLEREWQGNIRELENAIESAVVTASSGEILPENLPIQRLFDNPDYVGDFGEQLKKARKRIVTIALHRANGNYSEAARLLNILPTNMHRLAREIGLKNSDPKPPENSPEDD